MIREIPLSEIHVKPLFESQIPPLQPDELKQLEDNILEEGCIINPLILWKGIVIDGHNRFYILQKHPEIRFSVFEREFDDENDAVAWICKNQLGRRNLTPGQKKYLIGKQYNAEKQSKGGARNVKPAETDMARAGQISNTQNEYLKLQERTCDRIARENHVGHCYVQRAEKYALGIDAAEEAAPGTRQRILSGELKPTAEEIANVAKAADLPEKRKLALSLGEQAIKKARRESGSKGMISEIRNIAEHMESQAAVEQAEMQRQLDDQTALDELTDAWETFYARWEACFELHSNFGTKVRKKITRLTAKAIRYLQTKEEANEDN